MSVYKHNASKIQALRALDQNFTSKKKGTRGGQFSEEGGDQSEQIKELHRSVQEQIIRHNEQYKEHTDKRRKQVLYWEGDLVWIHLRKEPLLAGRFGKLKPRGDYLSPYKTDSDDEPNSGSSLFQEGKDDAVSIHERVN
ncbi:hypothetical protein Tco_0233736, partial [Tanacetum coccineum]